jgi:hypothetical protein
MVRMALGLLVGLLVAALVLYGGHYAYAELHPRPPGLDRNSPEALSDFAKAAPGEVIACILGAWALAGLLGGWFAAVVAGPFRRYAALVVGGLLTAAAIAYAALMPNQEWVVIVAMLLPIPFAVAASLLATPKMEF